MRKIINAPTGPVRAAAIGERRKQHLAVMPDTRIVQRERRGGGHGSPLDMVRFVVSESNRLDASSRIVITPDRRCDGHCSMCRFLRWAGRVPSSSQMEIVKFVTRG